MIHHPSTQSYVHRFQRCFCYTCWALGGASSGLVGLPPQFANAIYNDLGAELSQGFPIVDCSMALTSTSLNLLFQGITIAISIGQPIVPNSACFPASLAFPLAPAPVFQETVLFQHVSCLWYGQQPNLTGTTCCQYLRIKNPVDHGRLERHSRRTWRRRYNGYYQSPAHFNHESGYGMQV